MLKAVNMTIIIIVQTSMSLAVVIQMLGQLLSFHLWGGGVVLEIGLTRAGAIVCTKHPQSDGQLGTHDLFRNARNSRRAPRARISPVEHVHGR